jgi:hypothetical protein
MSSNLDTFVRSTRPAPKAFATSQEVRDRASLFVATIYRVRSVKEAAAVVSHVKHVEHGAKPASCEMSGWRCMTLKTGRTGLGEFDLSEETTD